MAMSTLPFVPTRRLVALAVVPFALGVAASLQSSLVALMWAADALVVLLALGDAWAGRRARVTVTREAPRAFSVGRPNAVRVALASSARRPLRVSFTDDRPADLPAAELPAHVEVPAGGRAALTYHVRPARRGLFHLGDHHVRHPTPLGLWARQVCVPARDEARVYPDLHAVRTYELLARQSRESLLVRAVRLRGGENEFERLREYTRDDDYRAIDWKATARRQKLITREYQQERNQTVVAMLDCGRLMAAESDGLPLLDHALNAVLMMAHVATRSGDQIGLCAFDASVRAFQAPLGGRRAAQRIVEAAYDLHAGLVEPDFDGAFSFLGQRLRKRALVMLFTQVVDDVSARTVLRHVRSLPPRHLPLVVLLRDLGVERLYDDPAGAGAPGDTALYLQAAAAETLSFREKLRRDLEAGGALVLSVAPRDLTPRLVNRYLQIKAQHAL